MPIQLTQNWTKHLVDELSKPYMSSLESFLAKRKAEGAVIYPNESLYCEALNMVSFDDVKIVILGQDPYHGAGQAHGLSFSVQKGVKIPPSLRNIYKELNASLGIAPSEHGCLTAWASQGVLLLNSVLTVEESKAGAHAGRGWEYFTDAIIKALNNRDKPIIFMLWGAYAQKKGGIIDASKHLVLKTVHPSPLSAHRGFIGCNHFKIANEFLLKQGASAIDWKLPD